MTIILLLAIGAVLWLSYKLAVAQGLIYTGVVDWEVCQCPHDDAPQYFLEDSRLITAIFFAFY